MYLYFNKEGVLKEIVNDKPLRQGSVNVDFIYAYFETEDGSIPTPEELEPRNLWISYKLPSGARVPSWTAEAEIQYPNDGEIAYEEIPHNPKRDLKFFKYYQKYPFYVIPLQFGTTPNIESALSENGVVSCTIRINEENESLNTYGMVVFNVEKAVLGVSDGNIGPDLFTTVAQFQYLLARLGNYYSYDQMIAYLGMYYYTKTQIDNFLALKADKVGPLPSYSLTEFEGDEVLSFLNINNLWNKEFIIENAIDSDRYLYKLCFMRTEDGPSYCTFEIDSLGGPYPNNRWTSSNAIDLTNKSFGDLRSDIYESDYELSSNKTTSLSSSSTDTEYPSAKCVYDNLSTKQNTLVSGHNIKTINGQSILGSGDLPVSGGGGGSDYTAGYGIDITDDTISVDTDEIATRDFVNSSIATNTATFRGTYNVVSDLSLTTSATHQEIANAIATKLASLSIIADVNDYVFVSFPNATISTDFDKYERYKFNGTSWEYEYTLNNSSFTAEQWAAINSGITSGILSGLATKVEVENVNKNIANEYDNTLTYTIGEVVNYNGKIYHCTTAITTPESWDSTHWTETSVASDFVNLTGIQTITGVKTFSEIDLNGTTVSYIKNAGWGTITFGRNVGGVKTNYFEMDGFTLYPTSNNSGSIGISGRVVNKVFTNYLMRNNANYGLSLPDMSSWTSNKEIATIDQAFNVVYVSEMTDSIHFTQAQVAIIGNGKPTRIIGKINNQYDNVIFLSCYDESNNLSVLFSYCNSASDKGVSYTDITKSNGYINLRNNKIRFASNELYLQTDNGGRNTIYINGKKLADYPTNPTMPQALIYDTDNSLKYVDTQKQWYGTQAEYDALGTYDSNTIYNILEN